MSDLECVSLETRRKCARCSQFLAEVVELIEEEQAGRELGGERTGRVVKIRIIIGQDIYIGVCDPYRSSICYRIVPRTKEGHCLFERNRKESVGTFKS